MLERIQRKLLPFYIDILNREYASGWCFNRLSPERQTSISFKLNGHAVGRVTCDLAREDLVEQRLHATGLAGFECVFDSPLEPEPNDRLTMHINGLPIPAASYSGSQVLKVFEPESRPLFFVHIPKTAGTSFNNYIRQYFGYRKSHTHIQTTPLDQQQELARTGDFLSGHITLEHVPTIFRDRPGVDLHSIVRNPAKQLHSHIGWVKGIAKDTGSDFFHKHHSLVQEMGRDLFQTDLSRPENLSALAENLDGFQIDFFDNIQTRYFLDYRPERVSQEDCNNAIANISRFKTLGLTEKFGEYTARFCDVYGIAQKPVTSVHNPSRVRPLFDIEDPALRTIIEPLVVYDEQLYKEITRQLES